MEEKQSLNKQIGSGLVWNFLERGGMQIINFLVQLVLARLLTPEDYGILAILSVFISLSSTFVNNGLSNAVIQKKNSDSKDFNTVFYFQLAVSAFFVALLFLLAPWVSRYYENPDLTLYLRVMSLTLLIDALYAMQMAKLKITMQFKKRFFANVAGIFVQAAVGIGMALAGCGIWSLIASQLAQKLVLMLMLTALIRWFPRAEFSFARLGQLFGYSWKLFVGWLIGTIHQDIYAFIIGKYFSTATLGYYNRASNLPQTVTKTVNETVSNVMFPALSKLQDDAEAFKKNTRRMMSLTCFLIWPITAGIAAVSESFVMVILTEKWAASIPMMQLFALAYGFNVISTANMQPFNALGRSDIFMKLEMVKRSVSVALLLVAAIWIGNIFAVIGVIAIMGLFSVCYNAVVNCRLLGYTLREQLTDMAPPFVLSAVMFVAVYAISFLPLSYTAMLILQILLGVTLYFGLAAAFRLPAMKAAVDLIKSFLKRR